VKYLWRHWCCCSRCFCTFHIKRFTVETQSRRLKLQWSTWRRCHTSEAKHDDSMLVSHLSFTTLCRSVTFPFTTLCRSVTFAFMTLCQPVTFLFTTLCRSVTPFPLRLYVSQSHRSFHDSMPVSRFLFHDSMPVSHFFFLFTLEFNCTSVNRISTFCIFK